MKSEHGIQVSDLSFGIFSLGGGMISAEWKVSKLCRQL